MGNFLSFPFFFFLISPAQLSPNMKNIVFEEFCKTLSCLCFWKVLTGMIFRISRCLYHARSSGISPWLRLPFTLQLFQGNKTKNNSHSTCKCSRDLIQTDLLSFFEVFIFSFPSKVIIIVIEFMLLDINMFYVLHRAHNPPLDARAKTSLSRAQNIVIPVNINYIVLI